VPTINGNFARGRRFLSRRNPTQGSCGSSSGSLRAARSFSSAAGRSMVSSRVLLNPSPLHTQSARMDVLPVLRRAFVVRAGCSRSEISTRE
jgi:hypothetical protein